MDLPRMTKSALVTTLAVMCSTLVVFNVTLTVLRVTLDVGGVDAINNSTCKARQMITHVRLINV